jgi:hypothetical protein
LMTPRLLWQLAAAAWHWSVELARCYYHLLIATYWTWRLSRLQRKARKLAAVEDKLLTIWVDGLRADVHQN